MPCRRASLRDCDTIFYAGPSCNHSASLVRSIAVIEGRGEMGDGRWGEERARTIPDAPALGCRGCEGVVKKGNHVSVAPIAGASPNMARSSPCLPTSLSNHVLRKSQLVSQSLIVPRLQPTTPKPASPRPMSLAGLVVGTGRSPDPPNRQSCRPAGSVLASLTGAPTWVANPSRPSIYRYIPCRLLGILSTIGGCVTNPLVDFGPQSLHHRA